MFNKRLIQQQNMLINKQINQSNSESYQRQKEHKETIEAQNKQTKATQELKDQVKELNEPTITIKLKEYNELLEKSKEYTNFLESIKDIRTMESVHTLSTKIMLRMKYSVVNQFLYDIFYKNKQRFKNANIENLKDGRFEIELIGDSEQ